MVTLDMPHILSNVATLAVAYILAIPIGWDREKAERSAGLRTFPLVAIAACAFVLATGQTHPEAMMYTIMGIITGIGFIGGGAIVKTGTAVMGMATAASLWATGALGVAVALGVYDLAVAISIVVFLTLRYVPTTSP